MTLSPTGLGPKTAGYTISVCSISPEELQFTSLRDSPLLREFLAYYTLQVLSNYPIMKRAQQENVFYSHKRCVTQFIKKYIVHYIKIKSHKNEFFCGGIRNMRENNEL